MSSCCLPSYPHIPDVYVASEFILRNGFRNHPLLSKKANTVDPLELISVNWTKDMGRALCSVPIQLLRTVHPLLVPAAWFVFACWWVDGFCYPSLDTTCKSLHSEQNLEVNKSAAFFIINFKVNGCGVVLVFVIGEGCWAVYFCGCFFWELL